MMIVSEIVAPFLSHLTIKTVFLILHYFIELTTHDRSTILKNIIYKIAYLGRGNATHLVRTTIINKKFSIDNASTCRKDHIVYIAIFLILCSRVREWVLCFYKLFYMDLLNPEVQHQHYRFCLRSHHDISLTTHILF